MPKISNLPAATSATLADRVAAVQGSITKRETLAQIMALFSANITISEAQVTGLIADLDARLEKAENLADLLDAATARINLGLGTAAVKDVSDDNESTVPSLSGAFTIGNVAIFKDVDGTLEDGGATPGAFLPLAGGTMAGDIDLDNLYKVINAAEPTNPQDYATKNYVDQTALSGTAVYAASNASLGTVTQSGSGIGATLTNAGAQATFALDGVNPPVGTNVLIKNTATGMTSANEGIYTVTDAGSGASNWVLTRASSYNTATEINNTGLIVVLNGTLAGTLWYNSTTIVTVDTTAFSFAQYGNNFAAKGANADITSMSGLTGYLQAPLGVKGSNSKIVVVYNDNSASAVNYVSLGNNITNNAPAVQAQGTDSNIDLDLKGKGTGGAMVQGVSTNSSASAGYVGEFISSTVLSGSAVSLTTGNPADITSISLTAGDWDVTGLVCFTGNAATTVTSLLGWISTTSASSPTPPNNGSLYTDQTSRAAGNTTFRINVGRIRISIASTTTVYLSANAAFAVNSYSAFGFISARRVR